MDSTITNSQNKSNQLEAEKKDLELRAAGLNEQMKLKELEIKDNEDLISKLKAEVDSLLDQNREKHRVLDRALAEKQDYGRKNNDASLDLSHCKEEIKRLKSANENLKNQVAKLSKDLNQSIKQKNEAETCLESNKNSFDKNAQEIETLKEKVN